MNDWSFSDGRLPLTSYRLIMMYVIPLLLGASLLPHPANQAHLPDEDSYRSDLSDTILESSEWRQPPPPALPWREPPRPKLEWRTLPDPKPPAPSAPGGIKLFPRYQPGRATDFDHVTREEKPLIKIFEFGP